MYGVITRFLVLVSLVLGLNFNAARADIELPVIKLDEKTLVSELAGPWDDTSSEPIEDDPVVCTAPIKAKSLNTLLSPNFGPLELSLKPAQMGMNFRLDLMKSYEIFSESRSPRQFISAFAFNSSTDFISGIKKILANAD